MNCERSDCDSSRSFEERADHILHTCHFANRVGAELVRRPHGVVPASQNLACSFTGVHIPRPASRRRGPSWCPNPVGSQRLNIAPYRGPSILLNSIQTHGSILPGRPGRSTWCSQPSTMTVFACSTSVSRQLKTTVPTFEDFRLWETCMTINNTLGHTTRTTTISNPRAR